MRTVRQAKPTNSTASGFATIDGALDYANRLVSDGCASSYEISAYTGPIYNDPGFRVTFFRAA